MRLVPSRLAAGLAALLLVASVSVAQEKSSFSRRNPVTDAVQKTKPSIVTIKVPRPNGAKDMIGTGVIVDESGIIITNNHVVGSCKHPRVVLHDGTTFTAEVLFAEGRWDVAALRIKTDPDTKLQALRLTSTDDLMVGESVIAIGHPFGYSNTVSTGIISALGREITVNGDVLAGLIQTDAMINPGNSGGPLLNINGELIGINCAIDTKGQGIAFAITANTINKALAMVMSAQRQAGVNHGLVCTEKIVAESGKDRQRVVVASFKGNDQLQAGDEIRAVGARAVVNAFDVERSLWRTQPGDTVQLKVDRQGKSLVVELTLAASAGAGVTPSAHPMETQPVAAMPTAKVVGVSER